ncbi:MAG: ATP-grasp domain-containing protein, partial [Leptospiraceae bacterium]|nr:ATP-grasp domain-containing protein [Leptospiraceae bacterium]
MFRFLFVVFAAYLFFPAYYAYFIAVLFLGFMFQILFHPRYLKISYYRIISYRYWEFWPAQIFYLPLIFIISYLCFHYRLFPKFLSLVNPCFPFGGLSFDSKYKMLLPFQIAPDYIAQTLYISPSSEKEEAIKNIQNTFSYPFVVKPDKGHRGNGFKIIRSPLELEAYLNNAKQAFLVQEYIPYPLEYGFFYIRLPYETKGFSPSITRKILSEIKGDGISSLEKLIFQDPRSRYLSSIFMERNKENLRLIPKKGETIVLGRAGNHCQGAIFEDGKEDIREKTKEVLLQICDSVPGFDFGRMDIKFKNAESLQSGNGFKILEVNGTEAEFTHIYDRKNNLFYAYRELYRQWNFIFQIATMRKKKGEKSRSLLKLLKL